MAQNNYQEPIEKKDFDLEKKLKEAEVNSENGIQVDAEKKEIVATPEISREVGAESSAEKISEKIETARQTIRTQKIQPVLKVSEDAQAVSQIQEFEKKVEKLVEIAVQKGPEHAIQVAQHMDKGKDPGAADNYTLDEIHDRLMEEELRAQLVQKGLLKEL
jgi:hypothetical protein